MKKDQKIETIQNIEMLSVLLSALGEAKQDGQSIFIGETIKLVLMAASEEEHAALLHKHVSNFLSEIQVLMGKKTLNEYLIEDLTRTAN